MSRSAFQDFLASELELLRGRLEQKFDAIISNSRKADFGKHRWHPTPKLLEIPCKERDDSVKSVRIFDDVLDEDRLQEADVLSPEIPRRSCLRKDVRLHLLDVDASVSAETPLGEIATMEYVNGSPSWIVGTLGSLGDISGSTPYGSRTTSHSSGATACHNGSDMRNLTRLLSTVSGNSAHTVCLSEHSQCTPMMSLPSGTFVVRSAWTTFEDKSFLLMASMIRRSKQNLEVEHKSESATSRWFGKRLVSVLYCSPASARRFTWDMFGLVLIVYDLITIPLRVFDPPENIFTDVMSWATQLFWNFDILASFFVGVYIEGELVMSPKLIALNYLRTWFSFDVFIVSIDWVLFSIGQEDESSAGITRLAKGIRILRFLRTMKLLRLLKLRHLLDHVRQHIWSEVASIQYNILHLFARIFIINHLLACLWYGIGTVPDDEELSWIMKIRGRSFAYRYTTSLYWALAQLGVGVTDTSPTNTGESIYAIVVLFIALFMFSSLVSSIVALMGRLQNMKDEETWQFWLVRRFCVESHISKDLTMRVQQFLMHANERRAKRIHDADIKIFALLSEPLYAELQYERFAPCLVLHPFFTRLVRKFAHHREKGPEASFVVHKVAKDALAVKLYGAGDPIFCCSNVARYMFFLEDGECNYIKNAEEVHLQSPVWISEPVLWTPWLHLGTLTGIWESQFISFDSERFPEIMAMHPETWSLAYRYAAWFVQCLNGKGPDELSDVKVEQTDTVWQGSSKGDFGSTF